MSKDRVVQTLIKMRDLVAPASNVYGIAPLKEADMPNKLTNILRVFQPIDSSKGRKANQVYGFDFDKHADVLSDSPITIAAKLGLNWVNYNNHVIVQSGICNFRCQYCYVDYQFLGKVMIQVSAEEIVEQFLQQREIAKSKGNDFNVLRISGGEPMLVPDLTLACLRMISKLGLSKEVFIKTETNLSPLVKVNGKSLATEWADFKELATYKNFIVHPTLHGLSAEGLRNNANVSLNMFDIICEGLQAFVEYGIDFYPSFGANTVTLDETINFFAIAKKIHKNLPLRIAVRPFKFDYAAITKRNKEDAFAQISKQNEIIHTWDKLLKDEYGIGYAEVPRHEVTLVYH